jgi:hypothetical protein
MNPYLESFHWRDFHAQYIIAIRKSLRQQIGDAYDVLAEEDVFVHEPTAEQRRRRVAVADVAVTRGPAGGVATAPTARPTYVARVDTELIEETHRWVKITDRESGRLVTAIELLSPGNKQGGSSFAQYLKKRTGFLAAEVNLVEIDLLRGGEPMPVDPLPPGPYSVVVKRADRLPEVDVWSFGLREALPRIPIPLRAPDPDATLDLQSLLHVTYDEAAYGPRLYQKPPDPPLSLEDQAWAEELLRAGQRA